MEESNSMFSHSLPRYVFRLEEGENPVEAQTTAGPIQRKNGRPSQNTMGPPGLKHEHDPR